MDEIAMVSHNPRAVKCPSQKQKILAKILSPRLASRAIKLMADFEKRHETLFKFTRGVIKLTSLVVAGSWQRTCLALSRRFFGREKCAARLGVLREETRRYPWGSSE